MRVQEAQDTKMLLFKWAIYPFITNHYSLQCLQAMMIFYYIVDLHFWHRLVGKACRVWHHLSWLKGQLGYGIT